MTAKSHFLADQAILQHGGINYFSCGLLKESILLQDSLLLLLVTQLSTVTVFKIDCGTNAIHSVNLLSQWTHNHSHVRSIGWIMHESNPVIFLAVDNAIEFRSYLNGTTIASSPYDARIHGSIVSMHCHKSSLILFTKKSILNIALSKNLHIHEINELVEKRSGKSPGLGVFVSSNERIFIFDKNSEAPSLVDLSLGAKKAAVTSPWNMKAIVNDSSLILASFMHERGEVFASLHSTTSSSRGFQAILPGTSLLEALTVQPLIVNVIQKASIEVADDSDRDDEGIVNLSLKSGGGESSILESLKSISSTEAPEVTFRSDPSPPDDRVMIKIFSEAGEDLATYSASERRLCPPDMVALSNDLVAVGSSQSGLVIILQFSGRELIKVDEVLLPPAVSCKGLAFLFLEHPTLLILGARRAQASLVSELMSALKA